MRPDKGRSERSAYTETMCFGEEVFAGVTQLVECDVANVIVAGSSPVSRSSTIKNDERRTNRGVIY